MHKDDIRRVWLYIKSLCLQHFGGGGGDVVVGFVEGAQHGVEIGNGLIGIGGFATGIFQGARDV